MNPAETSLIKRPLTREDRITAVYDRSDEAMKYLRKIRWKSAAHSEYDAEQFAHLERLFASIRHHVEAIALERAIEVQMEGTP